ncbi:MAG: gluconate 2-dehydrogenase subunit 3 family protein [Reichenbachiella sp.]
MDRRDTIKSLFLGSMGAGLALNGCTTKEGAEISELDIEELPLYGRTESELVRDQSIMAEDFFTGHELLTVATLCDIILPVNKDFGGAIDSGVTEFIDFIVKDMPEHQVPIRGGVMWLDGFSNKLFNKEFISCSEQEQITMCDQIAYPKKTKPALKPGEHFFTRMRQLTLTGYFTSKMGIEELGYKGNTPNIWDGIPEDILKDYSVKYEDEWLAKCVDQSKRQDIAVWDNEGNLISK